MHVLPDHGSPDLENTIAWYAIPVVIANVRVEECYSKENLAREPSVAYCHRT